MAKPSFANLKRLHCKRKGNIAIYNTYFNIIAKALAPEASLLITIFMKKISEDSRINIIFNDENEIKFFISFKQI